MALLAASGCSWIGVRGPGHPAPGRFPTCTTSYAAPTADLTIGLLAMTAFSVTAVALGSCNGSDSDSEMACFGEGLVFLFIGVPSLIIGTVDLLSAGSGYGRVSACRRAQSDALSRGLVPPPPPPPPEPEPTGP